MWNIFQIIKCNSLFYKRKFKKINKIKNFKQIKTFYYTIFTLNLKKRDNTKI